MDGNPEVDDQLRRARSLLWWNRPHAADRVLRSVLVSDPENVEARARKLSLDVRRGTADADVAVVQLETLIGEHPDSGVARSALATALHWSGHHLGAGEERTQAGLDVARALVDESPEDVPRRLFLGGFLLCVGRVDESWEEAQRALKTGSVTAPVHVAFAYRAAVRARDWRGARSVLRKASWAGRVLAVSMAHRWVRVLFPIVWLVLGSFGLLLSSVILEVAAGLVLVAGALLTGWARGWSAIQTWALVANCLLVQIAAYVIFVEGLWLVGAVLLAASLVVDRWMPWRKGRRAQPTPLATG